MEFRVLGPVEVESDGGPLPVGRRRERCLLGLLLLEVNHTVPADKLVELLWDSAPPASARRLLMTHVSRLRGLLASAGGHDHGVDLIATGGGYLLRAAPATVDAQRFRNLVITAVAAAPAHRIGGLRAALALWRGVPLADAASDQLRERLCPDLAELRLTAVEELMAARLALGQPWEALPELARLTRDYPARERLVELHMLALADTGRRVEALRLYERTRRQLGEELAISPGPALQRLHKRLLRDGEERPPQAAGPAAGTDRTGGGALGRWPPRRTAGPR